MLLAYLLAVFYAQKEGVKEGFSKHFVQSVSFWLILSGIIGARLFYILCNIHIYKDSPLQMLYLHEGGLSFFGGFAAGILLFSAFMKKEEVNFWRGADVFSPSLPLAESVARVGCFFAGCCHGRSTEFVFGVKFPSLPYKVHPLQLYISVESFLLFLFLLLFKRYKRMEGQTFLTYIFLHSFARFLMDFLRDEQRMWGLTTSQYICLILPPLFLSLRRWKGA